MEEEEEWVDYDGGAVQEWHRSASRIRVASGVAVIPARAFERRPYLRAVDLSNVTTISALAFEGNTSLDHIIWPTASAVEIGGCAFRGCMRLRGVDLCNATKIGRNAFGGCSALTRVSIPPSVTEVEEGAFIHCNNLAELDLGEGIQRIGKMAFYGCDALVRIRIPPSVTHVGSETFRSCNGLVEVELNEGLQRIRGGAFYGCNSLVRITIPSSTTKVGPGAFMGCHQLRHAEFLEGLQIIGERAFFECRSMERITIASSVKSVGDSAFLGCRALSDVTLREGVHCIDFGAFRDCTSLENINIPPVALVIDIGRSHCQLLRSIMPKPNWNDGKKLVVSKWMQYRSPGQVQRVEAKVNEILGLEQTEEEKIQSIREWSAYYDLLDVTTMLELSIWRYKNGNEQDADARQAARRSCGSEMNVIIPGVLPFLEG